MNLTIHEVRLCGLMDKAPDFGSGDCRFESCHGRYIMFYLLPSISTDLLCPYRGDFNILDFNDINKNGPCMLDKVIVKVRGHETRICEENYRVSLL